MHGSQLSEAQFEQGRPHTGRLGKVTKSYGEESICPFDGERVHHLAPGFAFLTGGWLDSQLLLDKGMAAVDKTVL